MNIFSNATDYKYLREEEVNNLFNTIDNEKIRYRLRNRAIFYTAKYCALRVSEVTNMKVSQINLDNREIYCVRGKNGNNNTLKIIDDGVYEVLNNYMNYRDMLDIKSEYLFTSQKSDCISRKTLDKTIKNYGLLAGIQNDKCHFHVLRHTRAIELAEMGLDTKEIQFWLGHKNISNTEIYFQFTSKQQDYLYEKIKSTNTPNTPNTNIDHDYIYNLVKKIIKEEKEVG